MDTSVTKQCQTHNSMSVILPWIQICLNLPSQCTQKIKRLWGLYYFLSVGLPQNFSLDQNNEVLQPYNLASIKSLILNKQLDEPCPQGHMFKGQGHHEANINLGNKMITLLTITQKFFALTILKYQQHAHLDKLNN